jgi:hypothetical protein
VIDSNISGRIKVVASDRSKLSPEQRRGAQSKADSVRPPVPAPALFHQCRLGMGMAETPPIVRSAMASAES